MLGFNTILKEIWLGLIGSKSWIVILEMFDFVEPDIIFPLRGY